MRRGLVPSVILIWALALSTTLCAGGWCTAVSLPSSQCNTQAQCDAEGVVALCFARGMRRQAACTGGEVHCEIWRKRSPQFWALRKLPRLGIWRRATPQRILILALLRGNELVRSEEFPAPAH